MQCTVRIIPNEKPWQLPGHFVDICQQQRQQTGEVHGDKPQIQELWRPVIFASVKVRAAEIPPPKNTKNMVLQALLGQPIEI